MIKKILILLIFASNCVYGTVFVNTIDTETPLGTDAPSVLDDRDREAKAGWQERLNVNMYFPLTGTQVSDADTGEFRFCLFHEPLATPATIAVNHGYIGIKDFGGKAELVWKDEDEQEIQFTSAGTILLVNARIANNTFIKAVDNAGTGTVDLIKATTGDIPEILVGAVLSADTAPAVDAGIANKKYVDDNEAATKYSINPMTGANDSDGTITYPNGMIQKWGKASRTGVDTTITFAVAFPNACFQAFAMGGTNADVLRHPSAYSPTAATFKVQCNDAAMTTFRWFAIGR